MRGVGQCCIAEQEHWNTGIYKILHPKSACYLTLRPVIVIIKTKNKIIVLSFSHSSPVKIIDFNTLNKKIIFIVPIFFDFVYFPYSLHKCKCSLLYFKEKYKRNSKCLHL